MKNIGDTLRTLYVKDIDARNHMEWLLNADLDLLAELVEVAKSMPKEARKSLSTSTHIYTPEYIVAEKFTEDFKSAMEEQGNIELGHGVSIKVVPNTVSVSHTSPSWRNEHNKSMVLTCECVVYLEGKEISRRYANEPIYTMDINYIQFIKTLFVNRLLSHITFSVAFLEEMIFSDNFNIEHFKSAYKSIKTFRQQFSQSHQNLAQDILVNTAGLVRGRIKLEDKLNNNLYDFFYTYADDFSMWTLVASDEFAITHKGREQHHPIVFAKNNGNEWVHIPRKDAKIFERVELMKKLIV